MPKDKNVFHPGVFYESGGYLYKIRQDPKSKLYFAQVYETSLKTMHVTSAKKRVITAHNLATRFIANIVTRKLDLPEGGKHEV